MRYLVTNAQIGAGKVPRSNRNREFSIAKLLIVLASTSPLKGSLGGGVSIILRKDSLECSAHALILHPPVEAKLGLAPSINLEKIKLEIHQSRPICDWAGQVCQRPSRGDRRAGQSALKVIERGRFTSVDSEMIVMNRSTSIDLEETELGRLASIHQEEDRLWKTASFILGEVELGSIASVDQEGFRLG